MQIILVAFTHYASIRVTLGNCIMHAFALYRAATFVFVVTYTNPLLPSQFTDQTVYFYNHTVHGVRKIKYMQRSPR